MSGPWGIVLVVVLLVVATGSAAAAADHRLQARHHDWLRERRGHQAWAIVWAAVAVAALVAAGYVLAGRQ